MPVIITDLNWIVRDYQGEDFQIVIVVFGSVIVAHEYCKPSAEPETDWGGFPEKYNGK
jgi:hypothetical protein